MDSSWTPQKQRKAKPAENPSPKMALSMDDRVWRDKGKTADSSYPQDGSLYRRPGVERGKQREENKEENSTATEHLELKISFFPPISTNRENEQNRKT